MESLYLCACDFAPGDHPLRQRASLLGHTALNSKDFELQWDPQGSRKRAANAPLALYEAKRGGRGARVWWVAGGKANGQKTTPRPLLATISCGWQTRADGTK